VKRTLTLAILAACAVANATDFTFGTPVRVPGTGTSGAAGVYPITFNVTGMGTSTTDINVTLNWGTLASTANVALGEEHTFADDLDFMLVAPTGQQLIFLSDAGGGNDMNGTYVFDDSGAVAIDDNGTGQNTGGNLNNGTYKPSQYLTGDVFNAPAPAASYTFTTFAGAFNGLNPNGIWSMYIMDDVGGDAGWLMSTTLSVQAVPEPATMIAVAAGRGALVARRRRK
jgi:subtilisin-like proprotein convertase family protein